MSVAPLERCLVRKTVTFNTYLPAAYFGTDCEIIRKLLSGNVARCG